MPMTIFELSCQYTLFLVLQGVKFFAGHLLAKLSRILRFDSKWSLCGLSIVPGVHREQKLANKALLFYLACSHVWICSSVEFADS
jgi:hypothetical protein